MYHDIRLEAPGISGGAEHFTISRDTFAAQLDQIIAAGLDGCSIERAIDQSDGTVVGISFDDGDAGQYLHAFPELTARNMTATFFITTDWVGKPGYVRWDQLREMLSAGMSIESHTRSHPFLSELDGPAVDDELAGAKAILDEQLDQDTTMLAFPGGDPPSRQNQDCIARAGYTVVATSRWGSNHDEARTEPLRYVKRCTIRGAPTLQYFNRILAGDPRVRMQRYTRETALRTLRAALGRSRYARLRAIFLDKLR